MRRLIIAAVILGGVWLFGTDTVQQFTGSGPQGDGDTVVSFDTQDQTMNDAMAEAQASLDLFMANATDAAGTGSPDASVKVAFETTDGGTEIIWVGTFESTNGTNFSGQLANQPNFMGDLNIGDTVSFSRDMIRDWGIPQSDGRLYGHYTTRVIAATLPADEAAQLNAILSPSPVPADWN